MKKIHGFTVRVYGVLAHDGHILLAKERIDGFVFTKFPGGGVEFGEGTRQALVREFKEETGLDIDTGEHLYTCDFFVESRFAQGTQVIGVYYKVQLQQGQDPGMIPRGVVYHPFRDKENSMVLKWTPEKDIDSLLTFEMDKAAWELIKTKL